MIKDITGKQIFTENYFEYPGDFSTRTVNISKLQNGVYLLSIEGNASIYSTKFIKTTNPQWKANY